MLEQVHPKVTRNTGQVKDVDATIFSVTTLQPGTTIETHMLGTEANVPPANFWPEGENVENFIAAATEGRYEEEDELDS